MSIILPISFRAMARSMPGAVTTTTTNLHFQQRLATVHMFFEVKSKCLGCLPPPKYTCSLQVKCLGGGGGVCPHRSSLQLKCLGGGGGCLPPPKFFASKMFGWGWGGCLPPPNINASIVQMETFEGKASAFGSNPEFHFTHH